jgi:light-regulated signal transduction histidine kinase (bacteriophytochrome)
MPSQDSDTVDQMRAQVAGSTGDADELQIQPAGFVIVLSLDWIVLRASENVDDFLGQSHVTLIEEPFSRFVQAQALHDLRNHFSRLSGSTGIARAYRVRLTDNRPRFDIAFQISDGRVLLEAAPSPQHGVGEAIGSVGGLIDGLAGLNGAALVEGGARRFRALTGCHRSSIVCGQISAESSHGSASSPSSQLPDLPPIVADTAAAPVPMFPRRPKDRSLAKALLRSPPAASLEQLREQGIGAVMSVPLTLPGEPAGLMQCENRSARAPDFELHTAAELFAQMFALRMEIDQLRTA